MNTNFYIAIISTLLLSLPVLLIIVMRLYTNRSFLALGIYYMLAFIYNLLTLGIIEIGVEGKRAAAITNNMLDVPLLLGFLMYFTSSWKFLKQMIAGIISYAAFELIVTLVVGFNINASTIVLGPGILIIAACSLYFFVKHIQVNHEQEHEVGKIAMLSALLFAYGCYLLIYIFHYVLKLPYLDDILLVYYLVTIITSLAMCFGIWFERKKILQSEADVLTAAPVIKIKKPENTVSEENEFKYM